MTAWAEIVGAAHVEAGGAAAAVDGVVPDWVVRPGSTAEVQACVRAAAAAGGALVASGHGAHLELGHPPRRLDVLLRLDRLARVLDHQAADMTVTVEAGCPLAVLAETLAAAGQWLPLDPPRPAATTVGGLVAANLSGPLRASQGTVRDLLLGLRVVGADGALVAGGGRVVKNVAGYDLPKLHVGALGTAGVIVEATFKVRPRPAGEEAVVLGCGSVGAAADTALAVRDLAVPPLWLELAGPGVVDARPSVAVGLGGIAEEIAAARAAIGEVAGRRGLEVVHSTEGAGLRARLGSFPAEHAVVLRAATFPGDVGDVMERLLASAPGARCLAHAASGVVRAGLADAAGVAAVVAALRPELEARGGALVVERAPADAKRTLDVWGDPGPGRDLMRRVKAAFDPAHLLSPGRFVAGL